MLLSFAAIFFSLFFLLLLPKFMPNIFLTVCAAASLRFLAVEVGGGRGGEVVPVVVDEAAVESTQILLLLFFFVMTRILVAVTVPAVC